MGLGFRALRVLGLRVLGFRVLGFRALGLQGLMFRVLGFRVLGAKDFLLGWRLRLRHIWLTMLGARASRLCRRQDRAFWVDRIEGLPTLNPKP